MTRIFSSAGLPYLKGCGTSHEAMRPCSACHLAIFHLSCQGPPEDWFRDSVCSPSASHPPSRQFTPAIKFAFKMSIICQNVALLTTTTIRTILTVYVTTSLSQAVGRPTPLTSIVASASCTAYSAANTTTQRCMTSFATVTILQSAREQNTLALDYPHLAEIVGDF